MVTFVFAVFMFVGGNNFVIVQPPIKDLSYKECMQMALDVNASIQKDRPLIGVCSPTYEQAT